MSEPAQLLPPVGILAGLTDAAIYNLSQFGEFFQAQAGTEVIRDGDMQDRLYVVVEGELKIFALVSGSHVELATVGAGECLGEVALFQPGPATATVQVVSETAILWGLDRNSLYDFVGKHAGSGGALLMGIAQCLSQRIRHTNATIAQNHHGSSMETITTRMEPIRSAPVKIEENSGLFGMFKKKQADEPKVKISKEIKM